MIPVLFKKNEQQFRTYGLGEITDIINPKVTRERNGQYLLYFQYPQNAKFSDVFEEDMRIKSDAGVRTKWQTFEISRVIRKEGQLIEVFAKHISQSLLKDALNPNVSIRSSNAQQGLRIWNNNRIGDEKFDVWSDISTTNSTNWSIQDVSNAFEALAGVQGSILDVWGGEYEFDNKMIRLHKEMGRKSPVPLEYGRNITGLEQDQQEDNVYTSVYPFATYTPEASNEPKTVTLPEHYIDGKYLEMHNKRKIQVVDFSGEFEHDDIPTVTRLRTLAKQYAETNEVGLPHENLKVEYIDLSKTLDYQEFQTMEEVELNDRLPIFYPKFGITNENAKVVVINYDPVKEENISIELGVIGQSFRTVTTGGIDSRLDRVEKQQDATNNYIVNAKGNRIWFETPDENMEHKIGDTWFEKNGPYDRIRVWNGNQWEVIIDTEDVDKIAKEVEQAQQEIAEVKQTADEAVGQINTAVANAGFTSLDETISSVQSISNQAQINSSTAINNALEAIQQASVAVENTGSLSVRVDEVENTLSVKADKQTVDDLTGVVDTHTLDIQANAQGLALKANQDTVDTLAGTVSSLGTEFDIVAGQVSSRVWNTDIESAIDGIEVGGRNLVLDSEGMYSGTNTSMNHYFELSPYATTNRIINATAITLDFDVITEDFTEGTIVLELQVIDENGTLRFIQNNATRLSRPQANHRVSRTIFLNDLNYEINEFNRVVMYARNFTGSVSIGNPKVSFSTTKSDWTPAPEDTLARFDHIETEWTQTFDTFSQTVSSIDGRVSIQEQTVSGMQSAVYDPETGLSSLNTQLANLIQVAVTGEEMTGAISVLENNINARVEKGDVINQINISDENILIQANKIMALGDVVVDGKLTITDEFIAPNAQIDGAKIADATIGSAKINDLDVNKISGNTTSFVSSAWNSNNASVFIDPYGVHSVSGLDTVTLRDGALWLDSNSMDYPTSVLLDGVGLRFATNNKTARMRFNGENLVLDNSLGLYGNHINSVNWLRLIGNEDYETVIHKHPTASGGAIVDSSMLTLGLGTRNSFSSIAQFYGQIDFRRNLHMLGNDIRSVNRVALENSNTHILSHHREAGGVLVDSTRFTVGIGSITTGFNDRLIVTNSQVAIDAHLNMRARRVEQVARLSLSDSSTHLMSLSTGGLLVDGARITIGTGSPSVMDPVARFFGQIHFYKNVYLNGNSIIEGSDERIKENIVDRTEDDLATIMAIDYKNFDMINGNKNQRGLIAQQLQLIDSDLVTENDGQLGYNSSNYVHTIGHAVQQLALREENTNLLASENRSLIEELQEENKELKNRIEELESAA